LNRAAAALAALALAFPAAAAAPAAATGLEWLHGSWHGQGRRSGESLAATLDVQPALGGAFIELRYRSGDFEGRALYRRDGERWRAHWFDNRGLSFPIDARVSGRSMTSDWGSAESERGRTVYSLRDDGRLEVADSVRLGDGSYRTFATHLLERRR
jgi:hypothetical protein